MTDEEASRLLNAYVDGELDPAKSLEVEAHLGANPAARAACERLRGMSAAIRDQADYYSAPAALAARLRESVPAAPAKAPGRAWRWGWLKPAAALATVAAVTWIAALFTLRPGEEQRIAQEALSAHVRATLADRLIDVASSDQHTVKPWMSARLDFSPPVTDLSGQGFELAGGRLDYVGGRSVAVLVYKRRKHVIDVFVWPSSADAIARTTTREGFNVEHFARSGMSFWLVSDLNRNELSDLADLLVERSAAP